MLVIFATAETRRHDQGLIREGSPELDEPNLSTYHPHSRPNILWKRRRVKTSRLTCHDVDTPPNDARAPGSRTSISFDV